MPFRQAAVSLEDEKCYRMFLLDILELVLSSPANFFDFHLISLSMASVSARNATNGESTMFTCPALRCPHPAWNRTFSSADELLEHARQTKAFHPLCTTCLRVFKDTAALDQVRDNVPLLFALNSISLYFVARRGETCRRMSTLQPEIQIAIRPRPTLACLICSSKLSRLRSRSSRYECPRYGEDLHDLMGLRAHVPLLPDAAHRQFTSKSALLRHASERERLGHALSHFAQPSCVQQVQCWFSNRSGICRGEWARSASDL